MLRVYVEGQLLRHPIEPATTVDDVLEHVRRDTEADGTGVILGVMCDGVDRLGEDLNEVLARRASDFERIDVRTGQPGAMVADALNGASATLAEADAIRVEAVDRFGAGATSDGIELLGQCLSRWSQVNEAIQQSIRLLALPAASPLAVDVNRLNTGLEPVRDQLNEIRSALIAQDFVTVTDLLAYEFDAVNAAWRDSIDALLSQIQVGIADAAQPSGA